MFVAALVVFAGDPAFAAGTLAAQGQGVHATVELVERRLSAETPPPISPGYESLRFAAEAPEGAPTAPGDLHGAQWAELKLGGKAVRVALGRASAEGEAFDLAFIDLDADGGFGEGERFELQAAQNETTKSWSAGIEALEARVGDAVFPLAFRYAFHPERGLSAQLSFLAWREGRAALGEREVLVAVLDADHDGSYAGEKDRWILFAADALPERPANAYALSSFSEGRFLDGHRYTAKPKDAASVEIAAKPTEGPDPRDLESHRARIEHVWFERFDAERERFVADQAMDVSRPRAERPIEWHYVTFDEAIALAEREDKALFVDVMAFWCVWCYRMDYYTYVDAEVAQLLAEEFVPVKIVQEQDYTGDYERVRGLLEAKGIPAMGIFDTEGTLLHMIGGWEKPEEFLASLQKGLALFRGDEN